MPSPSRSPIPATDIPKLSSFDSERTSPALSFISDAAPIVMSVTASTDMTCMAPRSVPPASSPLAPTTMAGVPSPSRSIPVTDLPNLSPSDSEGPFSVPSFISAVLLAVPSAFMNMTCRAPPPSPKWAPAAMSGIPSLSRSPIPATDLPKLSPSDSTWPPDGLSFILVTSLAEPSLFMSMTYTAPRLCPPVSSPSAPAAMSGMPSLSRSPIPATDTPNWSSFVSARPLVEVSLISAVLFTEPSAFMNMTYTPPRPDVLLS